MKSRNFALIGILASVLSACGGSKPKNIDGLYLFHMSSGGNEAYTGSVALEQASGSQVNVTSFQLLPLGNSSACFNPPVAETAAFTATGSSNGFVTGMFNMTVTTLLPGAQNNVLTVTGTRTSDGSVSGTWNMTGLTGCNGTGTFTMPVAPSM